MVRSGIQEVLQRNRSSGVMPGRVESHLVGRWSAGGRAMVRGGGRRTGVVPAVGHRGVGMRGGARAEMYTEQVR